MARSLSDTWTLGGVSISNRVVLEPRPGDLAGVELARRLAGEGVVAGIAIHPRHASQRHRGTPDYALVRGLVPELGVPVLVSGGLNTAEQVRRAFELTGADGVLLARGSLGHPWLCEEL